MCDKYWESLLSNFGPSFGAQSHPLCTSSEHHFIKTWHCGGLAVLKYVDKSAKPLHVD